MSHAVNTKVTGRIFSILGFLATLFIWNWAAQQRDPLWLAPAIALVIPLLIFPLTWMGRVSLDRDPTSAHADPVTRVVHFLVMCVIGSALICAAVASDRLPWGKLPFPARLADALTALTAIAVLLTVLNLAIRGFGAPWAISLSKRLATDWLYARTRNPMVLCLVLFLFCFGLHLHSALFLAWVAIVFIPAMVVFVRFYEERELEIRFGPSYLEYRAHTPMFLPRLRPH
jgi:protein-S-isoprenylcysteine O-methyltransferase Ste14